MLFLLLGFTNILSLNKINDLKYSLTAIDEELILTQNVYEEYTLNGISLKQLTPREFDMIVCAFAQAYELKPETVKTIIHIESSWNPKALSSADCRGLMQLHPRTALKKYGITKDKLYDPWINIRLGCDYYSHLLNQFDNERDRALVAYNSGPTNARKVRYPSEYFYVKKFEEALITYQ